MIGAGYLVLPAPNGVTLHSQHLCSHTASAQAIKQGSPVRGSEKGHEGRAMVTEVPAQQQRKVTSPVLRARAGSITGCSTSARAARRTRIVPAAQSAPSPQPLVHLYRAHEKRCTRQCRQPETVIANTGALFTAATLQRASRHIHGGGGSCSFAKGHQSCGQSCGQLVHREITGVLPRYECELIAKAEVCTMCI